MQSLDLATTLIALFFYNGLIYEANFLANDGTLAGTVRNVILFKISAVVLLGTFRYRRVIQVAGSAFGGVAAILNVASILIGAY
jgi:glucan phosphoethanolaminetransferase (alkaline phosphatase superfamily)